MSLTRLSGGDTNKELDYLKLFYNDLILPNFNENEVDPYDEWVSMLNTITHGSMVSSTALMLDLLDV